MLEKIEGIVVSVVPHTDRTSILSLYTRQHGRMSFVCRIGTGKGAGARRARLMPLSVISAEVNVNPTKELQVLGAFETQQLWPSLGLSPVKTAIVLFLYEFLNRLLRESASDEVLYDFLLQSLGILDATRESAANFTLVFLWNLTAMVGIQPDLSDYAEGAVFDLRNGCYTAVLPPHDDVLTAEEAMVPVVLSKVSMADMASLPLNAAMRRRMLEILLRYYAIHFPGTEHLKSPAVLQSVFS